MSAFQLDNIQLYAQRRRRLAQSMVRDAVAIIPTAPQQRRNRDSDYPYRHDSYFYYLTGFTEPDACLLLHADGRSVLLCQPKDLEREIWDGYRLGPQQAVAALGVDEAASIEELDERVVQALGNRAAVYFPFATHAGMAARVEGWLDRVRARARQGVTAPQSQHDVCALLDEMRLYKDAHELAIMRRAGRISAQAHIAAMCCSARMLEAGQDVREYHLEAELLHTFRKHGAQGPAYGNIVAAGANACVLHYAAGSAPVRPGELVLVDAACELDSYASDITRTFPANGRFTSVQRELYEIVLASEEAAIAAAQPGARFSDPHDAAVRVLTQGMLDVGLLDADKVGSVDDAIAQRAYFPYYMHRTSHWLGLDVHDCGSYTEPAAHGQGAQPSARVLGAGMVLTIEPGIYVRAAEGVPERFHNIGIRIEDDVVITADGHEVLTRDVPVAAEAIEQLMRG